MVKRIEVNGKTIFIKPTLSRFQKTAFQISEAIYSDFEKIGITEKYVDMAIPRNPLKRDMPAEISWYVNGENFYYKSDKQENYRDNLGVIGKVIQMESYAIRNGLKTFGQVMNQFRLDYNPDGPRLKTPREIIGVEEICKDLDYINYKYKVKAKELHSDKGGSDEDMKELNQAHETLKTELAGK